MMGSRKLEILQEHYEAFDRGDMERAARFFSKTITYKDQARGLTFTGAGQVQAALSEWKRSFSDARHTDLAHIDAGDSMVFRSVGRGTNDGPLGDLPPTGRTVSFPVCEVWEFDGDGRIARGEVYYDQLSVLTQLGHVPAAEPVGL
jgi:steroid delta-isomerase-like uncharacterized protein